MPIFLIAIFFLLTQCVYAFFTLTMWWYWRKIPSLDCALQPMPEVKMAVIVVVRNEERNLPALFESLMRQSYPAQRFEVYLVDDFSTDATLSIARDYQYKASFPLHILELRNYVDAQLTDGSFKKKGIEWAISQTDAELIVTTDGDCVVPAHWLRNLAAFYRHTHTQMICGGVTFTQATDTIFTKMQTIEFASLIGSGAATLQLGIPTMCNAANLAFTRSAFEQVGGYRDTASTATGDDLFLMHKIAQAYPNAVHFFKNTESTVQTYAPPTFADFYHQRRRWASKWSLYQDWRVSALAMFIFGCNFVFLLGFVLACVGCMPWNYFLVAALLRWSAEWVFLGNMLLYFKLQRLLSWIPVVQSIYSAYVVFFGLAVQRKGYQWKGRRMKE